MGVKMEEILYDVINPQVILTVKENVNDKMPAIEKRVNVANGNVIVFSISAKESSLLKVGVDRKSTRLNSSHPVISYAVFCLKKKMKKTTITSINRQTIKI